MKKKLFITVLAAMLFGSSFTVCAAPEYMADGGIFDAKWYLEQNPDVAAAFSADASHEMLYAHYTSYGIREGRTPYNAATFDPASVQPYRGVANNTTTVAPSGLSPVESYNFAAQYYRTSGQVVKSYLCENQIGGLTRVEDVNGQVIVEDYDSGFHLCASRTIPMELPLWGGFYAGKNYNFVIFGQANPAQDNGREVVRVVKYSKDWQRLGQASFYGANTTAPFAAGSLRCAEYGDYLYIRTCHRMYTWSDGRQHQANLTLAVRQSDMELTDSAYAVRNERVGYVSHSFNQFVLTDQNANIVTLDHGDAYPRGIVLMRYISAKAGGEDFSRGVDESLVVSFPGEIGNNYTGASVGGFAETANGYVTAFNYDGGTHGAREIYLGYTSKNGLASTTTRITTSAGMSTPILAPTGLDGGYIMWTDMAGNFYYARYADGGTVGAIGTAGVTLLSDCQPVLHNGELVWYATSYSGPMFFKIDAAGKIVNIINL